MPIKYVPFIPEPVEGQLQIAECALKIDISFTQEIRNSRSVNLVRMTLGYNVHQIFQKIKY